MPLYYTGYRTELLAVDEMIWALNIYCEIQQNGSGDPQIPPFKVIESDIVWLGIYDLLLVIYSAGLARTAGKMINISRKHKFSLPAVLNSPNELLLFCNAIWAQKTNDSPTRWCKKFCGKYYHFDAIPVLDRHRDGRKSSTMWVLMLMCDDVSYLFIASIHVNFHSIAITCVTQSVA